ncbi:DUF6415 family natural product biosynthesis protein [Streptomyces agglomeratus]|uniref:DUF6415 family natural product biosynthesis protein n=1 Tax=Streptomyces agglomeratus TaxID=285458 RepID=UPI00114CDCE2|nr:DUF6415 family natural product biosynthesis protein [Streptomyces agglomeratus]
MPYRTLKAALVHLDGIGEVVWGMHQRGEVLAPGDVHPDDVDLLREVRARISAGIYHRGQAMPTSILAVAHGIQPKCIPRAFRHLVADGTLHHDEHGPTGRATTSAPNPCPCPEGVLGMTGQPSTNTKQHPVDKVEIMALMDSVLGWDLSSRDRKQPPPETVEAALKQLAQHAVSLGRDLDAHIRALPRGDDVRRPAAVTLEEASRRLQATARSQGGALRAHNLARLVQALTAVPRSEPLMARLLAVERAMPLVEAARTVRHPFLGVAPCSHPYRRRLTTRPRYTR